MKKKWNKISKSKHQNGAMGLHTFNMGGCGLYHTKTKFNLPNNLWSLILLPFPISDPLSFFFFFIIYLSMHYYNILNKNFGGKKKLSYLNTKARETQPKIWTTIPKQPIKLHKSINFNACLLPILIYLFIFFFKFFKQKEWQWTLK